MGRPMVKYEVGHKFGDFVYIGNQHTQLIGGRFNSYATFICPVCKSSFVAMIQSIKSGRNKSCGCHKNELASIANKRHGKTHTAEHRTWAAIKNRCTNPRNKDYYKYGGRGIKVCERWMRSFENFYNDMGKRPSPKHSLDRHPDTNGDYAPNNCRWATSSQQNRNKRNNVYLTLNGQTKALMDWSEEVGMKHSTLNNRLKRGWSAEDTLTIKPNKLTRWNNYKNYKLN